MKKNFISQSTMKYLLLAGDIIILYFSLWLTLLLRYQADYTTTLWSYHVLPFSIVFLLMLIVFYINDFYELAIGKRRITLFNKLFVSLLFSAGFAIIFFYLGTDRLFTIRPQRVLFIFLGVAAVLIYLWRSSFYYLAKSPAIANGLLVIGFNDLASLLVSFVDRKPELGLKLKAIMVRDDTERSQVPEQFRHLVINHGFDSVKTVCEQNQINTIASVIHPRENPTLLKGLFDALSLKINFFDITTFYENMTGKIPVNAIEQIWFLENLTESNKRVYDTFKRVSDVLLSLLLLIITLPLIPIISLFIKLESNGPVFFTQVRTGKDGKSFVAIKFRSMVSNAESNGPQWASKDDARVTKLGRILRKTRLDEIPQLINVLKGEMSLIGPRPERPEFIEQLQTAIPFYKERLLVKPGLTGWAQVLGPTYGGSKEESLEKLQYDLYYIKNRSIGLDVSIILKTIRTVLSRQGQ